MYVCMTLYVYMHISICMYVYYMYRGVQKKTRPPQKSYVSVITFCKIEITHRKYHQAIRHTILRRLVLFSSIFGAVSDFYQEKSGFYVFKCDVNYCCYIRKIHTQKAFFGEKSHKQNSKNIFTAHTDIRSQLKCCEFFWNFVAVYSLLYEALKITNLAYHTNPLINDNFSHNFQNVNFKAPQNML